MLTFIAPVTTTATETANHEVNLNSCVSWVRHNSFWGWDFPQVETAADIPAISDRPKLGGIALYNYTNNPHAALVVAIGTSTYDILETNFRAGEVTRRTLPLRGDRFLRGYFNGYTALVQKPT